MDGECAASPDRQSIFKSTSRRLPPSTMSHEATPPCLAAQSPVRKVSEPGKKQRPGFAQQGRSSTSLLAAAAALTIAMLATACLFGILMQKSPNSRHGQSILLLGHSKDAQAAWQYASSRLHRLQISLQFHTGLRFWPFQQPASSADETLPANMTPVPTLASALVAVEPRGASIRHGSLLGSLLRSAQDSALMALPPAPLRMLGAKMQAQLPAYASSAFDTGSSAVWHLLAAAVGSADAVPSDVNAHMTFQLMRLCWAVTGVAILLLLVYNARVKPSMRHLEPAASTSHTVSQQVCCKMAST